MPAEQLALADIAYQTRRQYRAFVETGFAFNRDEAWVAGEREFWNAALFDVKLQAAAAAVAPTGRLCATFHHAVEIFINVDISLRTGLWPEQSSWLNRQIAFWGVMAEKMSAPDGAAEALATIGGESSLLQAEAAARTLLLLGDPGNIAWALTRAGLVGAQVAQRLNAADGRFGPVGAADRVFIAAVLDSFHDELACRTLLAGPGEEAGNKVAAGAIIAVVRVVSAADRSELTGEPLVDGAAMLHGLRETAPQVLRAFLASFNATGVASPEIKARKTRIAPENWQRAKAHPIAAFLDFAGNVANADRLVFASGDDAPEVVAYSASIATEAFRQVLGELRQGKLDEAAAGERYAALIADPDEPMTRRAHKDGKVAAFRPAPAAALKAAAELEAELPWLGILLPMASGAEGILAAARERPQQAAIAGRYAEALRGGDEGKKYMALVRLGYGLLVTLALLQLAAKGRLGIGGGGADAIGTEGEAGAAMPAPDMTGAAGGVAITAGPLVLPLPANTGPTEMAAMAVRLAPRLDAPLSGDALDTAEQAVAGLLLLAAESFAGDEEPLLDAIIELAGEHEDEVLEERFARFGETVKPPPPAEALAPLRRDTARLVEGLARG